MNETYFMFKKQMVWQTRKMLDAGLIQSQAHKGDERVPLLLNLNLIVSSEAFFQSAVTILGIRGSLDRVALALAAILACSSRQRQTCWWLFRPSTLEVGTLPVTSVLYFLRTSKYVLSISRSHDVHTVKQSTKFDNICRKKKKSSLQISIHIFNIL